MYELAATNTSLKGCKICSFFDLIHSSIYLFI